MPIGAFGSTRVPDFGEYLRLNGIPFSGIEQNGDAPNGITVLYLPEATTEQQAWTENAKQEYDWRKRRSLSPATIYQNIAGLTAQQQNTIFRRFFAYLCTQHRAEVIKFLAELGISLPVDEVDPT